MPQKWQPPGVFLVGEPGSGKSAAIVALVNAWSIHLPVMVADVNREHGVPPNGHRFRPKQIDHLAEDFDGAEMDGVHYDFVDRVARHCIQTGHCILVCDDLNTAVREGQQGPRSVNYIVNEGRHHNIGFIFSCRRPAEVPRSYTAEARHRIAFRRTEPIDREYLKRAGFDPDEVAELPNGHFLHRAMGGKVHLHTDIYETGPGGVPRLPRCLWWSQ